MLPFANYDISPPSMRDQNNNHNSNNKRRKKRSPAPVTGGGGEGDLAVVKAAAWAWYQRKEGKPMMREMDLSKATSRRITPPRPSRYKLEATKNMILSENRVLAENRVCKTSLWYDDDDKTLFSHLLDTFEIQSISKRIDDLLPDSYPVSPTSSMFRHDHAHDYGNDHDHDHDHDFVERKIPYDHVRGFVKQVNKRKLWARLMMLKGPATVCGRNDDVDLRSSRKMGKVTAAAVALIRSATRGK